MSASPVLKRPARYFLPENSQRLRIILALLTVYTVWGSTYLAVRIAVESFPPFLMTSFRFMVAGGGLLLFLWWRGSALPDRQQIRNAALVGTLMLGGGVGGTSFAEQWVASGLAALAVAAVPIWAALFAGLWGRWPNTLEWGGLIVGLGGVALLNMENGMQANRVGALALIIAPMCWAFGSIWSRHLRMPQGLMGTAIQMLGGGVFLLFLGLISRESMTEPPELDSVLALIYLIVFGSMLAFSAYMYLLNNIRPAMATSYAYVNPVVAVMLGVTLAGEKIGPLGIVAMFIILGGVGLVALGREKSG